MNAANDDCHGQWADLTELSDLKCEFEGCDLSAHQVGIGDREEAVYFLCEKHAKYALAHEVTISIYEDKNEIEVCPKFYNWSA